MSYNCYLKKKYVVFYNCKKINSKYLLYSIFQFFMGCSSSRGVQVSQQSRTTDVTKHQNSSNDKIEPQVSFNDDFTIITTNTESICRIEDTNPIVCLGHDAFPIVTANLFLDPENPTNISLPVVAVSRYGNGISIAIGHMMMVLEEKLVIGDSEIFFSSFFHWAISQCKKTSQNENGENESELSFMPSENEIGMLSSSSMLSTEPVKTNKVLVIGYPQENLSDIKKFFRQFSLGVEFVSESKLKKCENSNSKSSFGNDSNMYACNDSDAAIDPCLSNEIFFSQYTMIFATSNVSFDKFAIQNYISKGGIFVALYIPPSLAKQSPSISLNIIQNHKMYSSSCSNLESAAFYVLNENSTLENCMASTSNDSSISYVINDVLIQTNLAFTYCSLYVGEPNSLSFKIQNKFTKINFINFQNLINSYIDYISNLQQKGIGNITSVDEDEMDEIVTNLRFYLMVIDNENYNVHYKEVKLLLEKTWNFLDAGCPLCNPQLLNSEENNNQNKPIPCTIHVICIVLIVQMLYSIPFTEFSQSPLMKASMGDIPSPVISDGANQSVNQVCKVSLTITPYSWVSTGLWLPRGAIAILRCNRPMPFLHIQIGCHQTSLLEKKGTWRRWPVVVMSYAINSNEIEFSSPFGGIVYIVTEMLPNVNQNENALDVEFEFEGLVKYPYAIVNKPDKWKETSKIAVSNSSQAPLWGELESTKYIFTLPSYFLQQHENEIESYFNIYDQLFSEILSFTSCNLTKPFRIVFDVDLVDNDSYSPTYPLVVSLDDIDKIFVSDKPTNEVLNLLKLLTTVSLRDGCIDSMTEDAISLVSACSAIKSVWKDFNPLDLINSNDFNTDFDSSLFKVLWDIHNQCDQKIIPNTLAMYQDPNFVALETQEDMWMRFVTELCNNGKKNFTNLLKKARPIPMNISNSIQSFPDYSRFTE